MTEVFNLPKGRRVVVGLAWKLSFDGNPTARAGDDGAKVVCRIERSGIVAAGALDADEPAASDILAAPKKHHSGALCGIKLLRAVGKTDSGVLVARLPGGRYWLCCVRDGLVVPGRDLVVEPDAEPDLAMAALEQTNAGGSVVMLSEGCESLVRTLGLETLSFALADLAARCGSDTALRGEENERPASGLVVLGVVAVLLLSGVVGWYFFAPGPTPPPLPLPLGKSQAELDALRDRSREEAIHRALSEALASPGVAEAVDACLARLWSIPLWIGAEPLVSYTCDGRSFTVRYDRKTGSPTFVQAFHQAYGDGAMPDATAASATLSQSLAAAPPPLSASISEIAALPDKAQVYDRLLTLGQRIEGPLLGIRWTLTQPADVPITYMAPDPRGEMKEPTKLPPERGFSTGGLALDFAGIALVKDVVVRMAAVGSTMVFKRLTAKPSRDAGLDFSINLEAGYVVH